MGSSKQSTKSSTGPWGPAQDQLKGALPEIEQQYQADKANPLVGQATDYLSGAIGGQYLDPNTNPHLGALTKSIMDPVQAATSAQFALGGRGTSASKSGLAGAMSERMASAVAQPLFAQYNTERGLQQSAAQMAPAMQAAGSLPLDQYLERLQGVGRMGQESTSTTKASPSLGQTLSGGALTALGLMGGLPWNSMNSGLMGAFGTTPYTSTAGKTGTGF